MANTAWARSAAWLIRIPLLVRYPRRFRPNTEEQSLVLSVDVAATAPRPFHGIPLDSRRKRQAVLIDYFSDRVFPRISQMGYQAIRTRRWKYIHYTDRTNSDGLYDLQADPFELNNQIATPRVPLGSLRRQLASLVAANR